MRSQASLRAREGLDSGGNAAYARGERSRKSALEQRAALVARGIQPPPANTVLPAVTGTVRQGQTLTCSAGTWTAQGTPSYAYQWFRGNTPISGATANTRVLAAADVGQEMFCRVTATDSFGSTSADSAFTIRVVAA